MSGRGFFDSWKYEVDTPHFNRREKGGLWAENSKDQSKADRQKAIKSRADKANKTLQAKLQRQAKAMQAKAQREAKAKAAKDKKLEAARRAKHKASGAKSSWW